jgi:iron complex outermembrane receptor protein
MRRILLPGLVLAAATSASAQVDTTVRRDTALLAPTVVTVTRTPLAVSRAPFAVGVNLRDEIQRGKPGLALDEALAGIPGVQVDNRFNYALGERISIRGLGARAQFGVRGVRVILDGIPMTLADGQTTLNNVDASTLSRAEVIRGPASSMHGNSAAGVIQLETDHTAELAPGAFGGELRTILGEDGLQRLQASLGGRTSASNFAIALSRLSFDGYRQWNEARNDHASFRFGRGTVERGVEVTANIVEYDGQNPGGMSRAMLAANRDSSFTNNLRDKTGERGNQAQLGITVRRDVGGSALSVSAHGLRREIENPIPQRIVAIDRGAGGARIALSGEPLVGGRMTRLSAGAELQLQDDDRRNFVSDSGRRAADTLNQRERVLNTAFFAQAAVDVVSRVMLLFGARYDRIAFTAEDRLIGAGNPDDSGDRTMSAVSPSIGLTVNLAPRLDVYTNYSTSFETPTTSELANQESGAGGINQDLDPQRTRSAEVGINGRVSLAGVVGSYQLSLYDARVQDALVPFEVAAVPGRQYFRNAGSTKHRGAELGTSLVLPMSLALRASYAHTDARFVRYSVTSGSTTTVYDGLRVPGVAANRADATLTFNPSRAFIDFETRASSSIIVNDANTERSESYVIHGMRAGLRDLRAGRIQFAPHIGVLNLFDREYNTSVVVNAFGGRFFEPGPGRSLYGGLVARF